MASIQNDALPMPSAVSVRSGKVLKQSTAGDFLFTYEPDVNVRPRLFAFTWQQQHRAVADAIRRHYREHCAAVFSVRLPRTGEVVFVRWFNAPSISYTSAVAASATGELEEVLAHE